MVKKSLLALGLCIVSLSFFPAFAQNNSDETYQQVLIPREVYVGDLGRIEYSFRSPVDFFALASDDDISGDVLTFDVESYVFASVADKCSVQKAVLIRNGLAYNMVVDIIPWKPGVIDFPKFDLTKLCCSTKGEVSGYSDDTAFYVDFAPINIASIVTRLGVTTISPPESPMLLPGTSYVVWFVIVFVILLFFGLGIAIVKFRQIIGFFGRIRSRFGFYKNAFSTKRKLRRLLKKKKLTDVDFSVSWQAIMKSYLEYRFRIPFASVTSNRIYQKISNAVGDMLNEAQDNAIEYIVTSFIRTDYIKFANGSIDSRLLPLEEHEAVLVEGERKKIVEMSESAISSLEELNDNNKKERVITKKLHQLKEEIIKEEMDV